jgi:hypothetical protein
MYIIHCRRIVCSFLFFLFAITSVVAQERNPLYDLNKIHFGFAINGNQAKMRFTTAQNYLGLDTMRGISAVEFPGFGVGGIMNIRMGDYWDFRTMMNITFAQRNLIYTFKDGAKTELKIESTYLEFPLLVKYKSKRHRNVRFYGIGGITYRYDFSSDVDTERSNSKPIVALYPNTFSYDIGCGLDFYFEFFKFSPEIKISNAFTNALVPDPYFYASSLKSVSPKLLQFSLLFE